MADKEDMAAMAEFVTRAIWRTITGTDDGFDDQTEEERRDFLLAGHAAMAAHDAWLTTRGFKIIPPGTVHVPTSDEEARAMIAAVEEYKKTKGRKKSLFVSPTRRVLLPEQKVH